MSGIRETPAPAWQPIETAPKDGTSILIGGWEIYPPDRTRWWVPSLVYWNIDGEFWDAEGAPRPLPQCTHWMPLPAPPVTE